MVLVLLMWRKAGHVVIRVSGVILSGFGEMEEQRSEKEAERGLVGRDGEKDCLTRLGTQWACSRHGRWQ